MYMRRTVLCLGLMLAVGCEHSTKPDESGDEGRGFGAPDASDRAVGSTAPTIPPTAPPPTRGGTTDIDTYTPMVDPTASNPRPVDRLVATINGTPDHPEIRGTVTFRRLGDQVEVQSDVQNLPSGMHAYHVHVFGDCSNPGGDSAGPHLDFKALGTASNGSMGGVIGGTTGTTGSMGSMGAGTTPSASGSPGYSGTTPGSAGTTPGSMTGKQPPGSTSSAGMPDSRITGNLGELNAIRGKPAQATTTLMLPASSLGMLNGRSVEIHTGDNDPKSTDGGAGAPLACGVIGVANEMTMTPGHTMPQTAPPVHSTPTPSDPNDPVEPGDDRPMPEVPQP